MVTSVDQVRKYFSGKSEMYKLGFTFAPVLKALTRICQSAVYYRTLLL